MDLRRVVIQPGQLWWASPDPSTGREQAGRRPVLIVSNLDFHTTITTLVLVVPLTTVDRGWPNHVAAPPGTGLTHPSWAMTEQVRAISRNRLDALIGQVDTEMLGRVRHWIADYLC